MFQPEFLVSPTSSREPHQKVDARFRDPIIDIEPARDLIRYIKNFTFESNAEILVNVAITVTVSFSCIFIIIFKFSMADYMR